MSRPQVFAFLFMSLDGCVADPDEDLSWALTDEEFLAWNIRQCRQIGALLLGRRTYVHFAEFWTTDAAAAQWPEVSAFMGSVPKTVVTRGGTPLPARQGTRTVDGGDLTGVVRDLRAETTGDVAILGSPTLAASLLELGLLDELRILIHPVLLGDGHRLMSTLTRRVPLDAGATTVFRSGNILLTYHPRTD